VDNQPIFVVAEIENHSVVAYEIDSTAELPLYFGLVGPMRLGRDRELRPNWAFGMWVARPKFFQRAKGDHLHGEVLPYRHQTDLDAVLAPLRLAGIEPGVPVVPITNGPSADFQAATGYWKPVAVAPLP
jgi:hypothetical protein